MIQLLSLSLAVYQFCSREVRLRCICIRSYFPGKGFLHTLKHRIKCFWPMQQWAKHTCIYSNHKENSNNKPGINVVLKNFHFFCPCFYRWHCRWGAAKFRPMLGRYVLWEGRNLYRAHLLWYMALVFAVSSALSLFSRRLLRARSVGDILRIQTNTENFRN